MTVFMLKSPLPRGWKQLSALEPSELCSSSPSQLYEAPFQAGSRAFKMYIYFNYFYACSLTWSISISLLLTGGLSLF